MLEPPPHSAKSQLSQHSRPRGRWSRYWSLAPENISPLSFIIMMNQEKIFYLQPRNPGRETVKLFKFYGTSQCERKCKVLPQGWSWLVLTVFALPHSAMSSWQRSAWNPARKKQLKGSGEERLCLTHIVVGVEWTQEVWTENLVSRTGSCPVGLKYFHDEI